MFGDLAECFSDKNSGENRNPATAVHISNNNNNNNNNNVSSSGVDVWRVVFLSMSHRSVFSLPEMVNKVQYVTVNCFMSSITLFWNCSTFCTFITFSLLWPRHLSHCFLLEQEQQTSFSVEQFAHVTMSDSNELGWVDSHGRQLIT